MEKNLHFSGHASSQAGARPGVSATAFLMNLENAEQDREMMKLDESIAGMEEESHLTKLLQGKLQELRHTISQFALLSSKPQDDIDFSLVPPSSNIILFGPAGSGKSSVIRTVYSALSGNFALPKQIANTLLIQKLHSNEGTTKFSQVEIQRAQQNILKAGGVSYEYKTSGISMFDTRGQILLDDKEKEALNIMIDVCLAHSGKSKEQHQDRESDLSLLIHALRILEERL